MYMLWLVDKSPREQYTPKEVITAAHERKRRPGCNRAAHDPE
jgi:hypothetical protein